MAHIPLGERQALTTYRKIAIAGWRHPRDPSTYCWLDLPVGPAEAFLKAYPADTRPSLTHFVAKVVADCLEEHPALNHLLRGDALYRRARTDVFITTLLNTAAGRDLSGFVVRDVPGRDLGQVARLSEEAGGRLRRGEDDETRRVEAVTARLPVWLLRVTMALQAFAHFTLNVSLRRLGLPDDRFGSVIISNFGVLGIENALVPLSPYCRCPLVIGMGRPRPMPTVQDGEVRVAECITLGFTFDHRYADGVHGGLLLRRFQKIFRSPARYPDVFKARGLSDGTPSAAPTHAGALHEGEDLEG